jgi:hypothetical protein
MSPEIDYTRQRTVAELLAEHGESGGPGRRRHRRDGQGPQPPMRPPVPPPPGPGAPPPHDSRRHAPPDGPVRGRGPREQGPPPVRDLAPRHGGGPVRPGGSGVPAGPRRDRPAEIVDDRRPRTGPPGPVGFRDGPSRPLPPRGAPGGPGQPVPPRPTGSGPMRAVPPTTGAASPANGSGPMRPVPQTNGSGPMRPVPQANGSGPMRSVPQATGSGPMRSVPPGAGGREAPRNIPGAASNRLDALPRTGAPAAPGRDQHAPAARPVGPRDLPARAAAGPPAPSLRSAGPWPDRDADAAWRRDRPVADPGPSTGAFDPFAFDEDDDEDDDVGPVTVVGRTGTDTRPRPGGSSRRDPAPGARPGGGAATAFDARRRAPDPRTDGDGPATLFDSPRVRRDDGPATEVGTDLADDGPATMADVRDDGPATMAGPRSTARATRRRGDDGPATVTGPRADPGPPTEVGQADGRPGGRRRAPGRSGFGLGLRTGRPGGADAEPAAALGAAPAPAPPAPGRAAPAHGGPGRAPAPPVRRVVDSPTELNGRGVDDRTEVAEARRRAFAPPRQPDLFRSDGYDDDRAGPAGLDERDLPGVLDDLDADLDGVDLDGRGRGPSDAELDLADLAERDLDDRHLDDRHLDDRHLDDRHLDDRDLDDRDLDERDLDDPDLDDPDLDDPAARPAHAWAGVVAQWLAGAVAGAVLWVLFRYLWRGLPVVALAAALLVTAGLVLVVRQFLHDVDRRTTMFAVLVGLLLTASPAVLVLLGR